MIALVRTLAFEQSEVCCCKVGSVVKEGSVGRYTLIYRGKDERIEALSIPFSQAKAFAIAAVEKGSAHEVTVRDDVNRMVFRYPSFLRNGGSRAQTGSGSASE